MRNKATAEGDLPRSGESPRREETDDLIAILRADREDQAPAELFSAARWLPVLVNVQSRPHKAPQERRSPDNDGWRNSVERLSSIAPCLFVQLFLRLSFIAGQTLDTSEQY